MKARSCCGAADERLDLRGSDFQLSVFRWILWPATGDNGDGSVGFLLFILFTSNPFSRTLPNFRFEAN
ncbi:hypothetical protein ACVXHA_03890 [Escherichia coli]